MNDATILFFGLICFLAGWMSIGIYDIQRENDQLQKEILELEKKNYKLEETLSIQKAGAKPEWK